MSSDCVSARRRFGDQLRAARGPVVCIRMLAVDGVDNSDVILASVAGRIGRQHVVEGVAAVGDAIGAFGVVSLTL